MYAKSVDAFALISVLLGNQVRNQDAVVARLGVQLMGINVV